MIVMQPIADSAGAEEELTGAPATTLHPAADEQPARGAVGDTGGASADSGDPVCLDAPPDKAVSTGPEDGKPPAAPNWTRLLAVGLLPALAIFLTIAAGFLKWQNSAIRPSAAASIESVAVAKDATAALLSYQPDTVEKDLTTAGERLTGKFKDSYTQLIHDVVIPGAIKEHVSAIATVPAAALVSATQRHAVVLAFVDQTVVTGTNAPTESTSAVRVTLLHDGNGWLISDFTPV